MKKNIDVRCPRCNSDDLKIVNTHGQIKDATISEITEYLTCHHSFKVNAKIFYKEIGDI